MQTTYIFQENKWIQNHIVPLEIQDSDGMYQDMR